MAPKLRGGLPVAFQSSLHAQLLQKVFDPPAQEMSRPLAESILALDFPEEEAARAQELSSKANDGTLSERERAELEAYVNISDLLAHWQSRARYALQRSA
jgi:hypothetical protein